MAKLTTLLFLLLSGSVLARPPEVPDYGKLLLLEERSFSRHFELGLEGSIALDNTTEDVFGLGLLANYVLTPFFSAGLEVTRNTTENRPYLSRLEKAGNLKVSNYTPDWFTQLALRFNLIKGHLNIINKWHSSFEMALVLGGGSGFNEETGKSSSLISWGGELLVPFKKNYKAVVGIRHYKSYAFETNELSFTSLNLGVRRSF